MSKKIPLHFSDEFLAEVEELAGLLGMDSKVYGYIPKTLRFGIALALDAIKTGDKSIPGLKGEEFDLYVWAVKRLREKRALEKTASDALERAAKV